jgi:SH3-like domain-containing protein
MQPCEHSPAPIAQIDAALAAGKPVILQVDWNKQAGIQTHFVLVKEKKGNDYVLYDPYKYAGDGPGKEVLLTRRYKYNGATIEDEISAVLWFDSAGISQPESPAKTTIPLPVERYTVYGTVDDLALRAEPSAGGYLWKRIIAGTELIALEPKAAAKAKVGVNGQWLNVQDPDGNQGYVAAWFVSEAKGQPSVSTQTVATVTVATTISTTSTSGTLVFAPIDELALRSQPVIDPKNMIRRIPVTETLTCLEPTSQATPKVGVTGQWLKVRDAGNREGYVAAWYVKVAAGAQPASSGPLQVKTTSDAIALRKQPVINDSNLIKRVPLGTVLTVTEPNAENKVGKSDQWLKVKDPAGTEGYVAAWLVAR